MSVLEQLLKFLSSHQDCGQVVLDLCRNQGETARFYCGTCTCGAEIRTEVPGDDDRYQIVINALAVSTNN